MPAIQHPNTSTSGNREEKITAFQIGNEQGITVRIINFGCIITDIRVPGRRGNRENVVIKLSDDAYTSGHPYIGATVGRYANRIANGRLTIGEREYTLSRNEPPNHLHGGFEGLDKKIWNCIRQEENLLELGCTSMDGEEGYPGKLQLKARFEITDSMDLSVTYMAETDQSTPVNITNHSYFNLTGNPDNTIRDHVLQIHADQFTPASETGIPDGRIHFVAGTPFDFRSEKVVGKAMDENGDGLDLNYVLTSGADARTIRKVARLHDPESGRTLEVLTDKPGLQLYTGGGLDGSLIDHQGRALQKYAALCLESQFFPDAPNKPQFPSTILKPGERYQYQTIFRFSV